MKLEIISSVNSGICIITPSGKKIWVDFYPGMKTPYWEYVTDEMWAEIRKDPACSPPDIILTTHCHCDHFSLNRTKEILEEFPQAKVICPAGQFFNESAYFMMNADELPGIDLVRAEKEERTVGDIRITFLSTVHSDRMYSGSRHYSIVIRTGGKTVFVSGDAKITSEPLREQLESMRTDLAILNFPWITLEKGREIVTDSLMPGHIFAVHLPAVGDDPCGFRRSTENGARLTPVPDIRFPERFLQKEVFVL